MVLFVYIALCTILLYNMNITKIVSADVTMTITTTLAIHVMLYALNIQYISCHNALSCGETLSEKLYSNEDWNRI